MPSAQALDFGNDKRSPLSSLNYDILRRICDFVGEEPYQNGAANPLKQLDGLSKTSHGLRDVSIPALFSRIGVTGHWVHVFNRLEELENCPMISRYTKSFKFDLTISGEENDRPPPLLARKLASFLGQMNQLEKLELIVPGHHATSFAEDFAKEQVTFPKVHTLVISPFCDCAVKSCPNLKTIATGSWNWSSMTRDRYKGDKHTFDLIKAAGTAPQLNNLYLLVRWDVPLLEAVLVAVPNIKNFVMGDGPYKARIADLKPILSRFKNLERLVLAEAVNIRVGFNPPRCGNILMGPNGAAVTRRIVANQIEAEEKAATMLASVCKSLKELWVGKSCRVEVVREADGSTDKLVWHRGETRERLEFAAW